MACRTPCHPPDDASPRVRCQTSTRALPCPRMLGRPLRMLAAAALSGAVLAATASAVVGGTAIAVQSAPWAVFVKHTSTSEFRCSGSVVDASHVLTAAHCLFDDACNAAAPASFQVRAGASN